MRNVILNEGDYSIEFTGISFTRTGLQATVILRQGGNVIDGARLNLLSDDVSSIKPELQETVRRGIKEAVAEILSVPTPLRLTKRKNTEPRWLIQDLLLENSINLICAPGGVGKSLFALYTAMVIENGIPSFDTQQKKGRTLYLDWEVDYVEASRRATKIGNFLKTVKKNIRFPRYMLMTTPLRDSIGRILQIAPYYDYIIIDSAAPASGGDVSDSSMAIGFFDCVRSIVANHVTVLILSHISKAELKNADATPIGSIYYENIPRLVWRMSGEYNKVRKELSVVLACRKSNTVKPEPWIFTIGFDNEMIRFENHRNNNIDMVMMQIIKDLEGGERTVKELLKGYSYDVSVITEALDRLQKSGVVCGEEGRLKLSINF
jgi:hypothetical protein